MIASSCLTVIGMPLVFLDILYSLDWALSVTYIFYSMWQASSERAGWIFIFA